MRRPTSGRIANLPTRSAIALVVRMHRDRDVAEHRLGPRGRNGDRSGRARPRWRSGCARGCPSPRPAGPRGRRSRSGTSGPSSRGACPCRSGPACRGRRRPSGRPRDRPSSMVKRSRDQSQEAPRRLQLRARCVPPDSSFHSQTRLTKSSRPRSRRWICRSIELALDDHLGGDAGMVHARLPEHVPAAHALEAAEDVLHRVVERVPHMERAGDVRRRDDDRVGLASLRSSRPALKASASSQRAEMRASTAAGSNVLSIMVNTGKLARHGRASKPATNRTESVRSQPEARQSSNGCPVQFRT